MRKLTKLVLSVAAAIALAAPSARAQTPSNEIAAIKIAIDLVQRGKGAEALATSAEFRDPAARALIVWLALRIDWKAVGFDRGAAFLREHTDWPSISLVRRRVESMLYEEKRDPRTVRAFFNGSSPVSGEGKLALARALLASGDRIGALPLVRSAWREDSLSGDIEQDVLDTFKGMIERADHQVRADRMIFAGNSAAATRAAERGGADLAALVRARIAVDKKSAGAAKLLDAVPASLKNDPGLLFARMQYRRQRDDMAGAAKVLFEAPRDPALLGDTDEWWREVRLIVRGLLDDGDPRTAYRAAAHAGTPASENYKADQHFTAGWIALRFLKDIPTAARHFAAIEAVSQHPTTLSRAFYWQGRASEAAGQGPAAQAAYQKAARFAATYYGQLARAKLGHKDLPLNRPVEPSATERAQFAARMPVRALRLLYATGSRELTVPFYADFAERTKDDDALLLLASVAYEHRDARGMVLIGKAAYARGSLIDSIAFPVFGVPDFAKVEPPVDPAVVYAIARQESQFMQSAVSTASAYGLMQVIPSTARAIAKRLGIPYDINKLRGDPVYNARLGAAELGNLLDTFGGSYVLTFVGYNAGPGRARQWIARYGDPRDPKVDPVDWVERIPFSETRYYVQRVMENMQVYRVLFGNSAGFRIEADLARGRIN